MKGPVCRGQVALNVIQDQFWVVFRAPNSAESKLGRAHARHRRAQPAACPPPTRATSACSPGATTPSWKPGTCKNKSQALALVNDRHLPTVDHLWDGDGSNPTAGLTVFRHFDSASVIRGLVGERPQTAMVFGYPLFERMHYLLLAGFDIYGNIGHQLATRLYMDFLRMEGELDFLALLPTKDRQAVLDHWYRGRSEPTDPLSRRCQRLFPARKRDALPQRRSPRRTLRSRACARRTGARAGARLERRTRAERQPKSSNSSACRRSAASRLRKCPS